MPSWRLFQMWEPVRYTARPARSPDGAVKYRGFLVDTVNGPATVLGAALIRGLLVIAQQQCQRARFAPSVARNIGQVGTKAAFGRMRRGAG
jgi:hypothetical protein